MPCQFAQQEKGPCCVKKSRSHTVFQQAKRQANLTLLPACDSICTHSKREECSHLMKRVGAGRHSKPSIKGRTRHRPPWRLHLRPGLLQGVALLQRLLLLLLWLKVQ